MTATWKCLISSFAVNLNKAQQNFTSLYEIGYGPLEFNMGLPTLHKVGRNKQMCESLNLYLNKFYLFKVRLDQRSKQPLAVVSLP